MSLNIRVVKPSTPAYPRIECGPFVLAQRRGTWLPPAWKPEHLLDSRLEDVVRRHDGLATQAEPNGEWRVHNSQEEALEATREARLGVFSFLAEEELDRRLELLGSDRVDLNQEVWRFG